VHCHVAPVIGELSGVIDNIYHVCVLLINQLCTHARTYTDAGTRRAHTYIHTRIQTHNMLDVQAKNCTCQLYTSPLYQHNNVKFVIYPERMFRVQLG
jgi:hypothetical protein